MPLNSWQFSLDPLLNFQPPEILYPIPSSKECTETTGSWRLALFKFWSCKNPAHTNWFLPGRNAWAGGEPPLDGEVTNTGGSKMDIVQYFSYTFSMLLSSSPQIKLYLILYYLICNIEPICYIFSYHVILAKTFRCGIFKEDRKYDSYYTQYIEYWIFFAKSDKFDLYWALSLLYLRFCCFRKCCNLM